MTAVLTTPVTSTHLSRLTGLDIGKLNRWCAAGAFGPGQVDGPGTGTPRRFTVLDVVVARACMRVADAYDQLCPLKILAEVGAQVRAGRDAVRVELAERVELWVDVGDLRAGLADGDGPPDLPAALPQPNPIP